LTHFFNFVFLRKKINSSSSLRTTRLSGQGSLYSSIWCAARFRYLVLCAHKEVIPSIGWESFSLPTEVLSWNLVFHPSSHHQWSSSYLWTLAYSISTRKSKMIELLFKELRNVTTKSFWHIRVFFISFSCLLSLQCSV